MTDQYEYVYSELDAMPLDSLYHLADSRGLLSDLGDEADAPDADQLVAIIIEAQQK